MCMDVCMSICVCARICMCVCVCDPHGTPCWSLCCQEHQTGGQVVRPSSFRVLSDFLAHWCDRVEALMMS